MSSFFRAHRRTSAASGCHDPRRHAHLSLPRFGPARPGIHVKIIERSESTVRSSRASSASQYSLETYRPRSSRRRASAQRTPSSPSPAATRQHHNLHVLHALRRQQGHHQGQRRLLPQHSRFHQARQLRHPQNIAADNIVSYVRAMQNSINASSVRVPARDREQQGRTLEFSIKRPADYLGIPLKNLRIRRDTLLAAIIPGATSASYPAATTALKLRRYKRNDPSSACSNSTIYLR